LTVVKERNGVYSPPSLYGPPSWHSPTYRNMDKCGTDAKVVGRWLEESLFGRGLAFGYVETMLQKSAYSRDALLAEARGMPAAQVKIHTPDGYNVITTVWCYPDAVDPRPR
jgi:hypothetical protein